MHNPLGVANLIVLLDEWTAIPLDVQPYVAEFLKRTVIPSALMSLKIGSLAYGSVFSVSKEHTGRIGFEFGGAIAQAIDLDDFYTLQWDLATASTIFTDLLWRHLTTLLPHSEYLKDQHGISSPVDLKNKLFKDDAAFTNLLMAASGVVRDFLGIFTTAYFRAAVARTNTIEVQAVRDAARISFEAGKLPNLTPAQDAVLEIIGRQLNTQDSGTLFLLDRQAFADPIIEALLDARVIHVVERNYSGDVPTGPYTLYSLDLGAVFTMRGSFKSDIVEYIIGDQVRRRQTVPPVLDYAKLIRRHSKRP